MIITHNSIKTANKKYTVPEELGGVLEFDSEGKAEVSEELGEYAISAGFTELITSNDVEQKETDSGNKTKKKVK